MRKNEKRRPIRKSDAVATVANRGPIREQENAHHDDTSAVGHFAHVVRQSYLDTGWHCTLPLPEGMKYPPPDDTTGNKPYPDANEITELWSGAVRPNLGLRMPRFTVDGNAFEVIGLDVDDYDDKHGYETLRDLVDELGPLPMTYRSTSRDPDNPSGIRFFLVPADLKWKGKPGPDIEVIQRTHRYAVAWPSTNPDSGGTYTWYDLDEQPMDGPPHVADLPSLPEPWIEHLRTAGNARTFARSGSPAPISDREAADWLAEHGAGRPDARMKRTTKDLARELRGGSYDAMRDATWEIVSLAAEGHPGAKRASGEVVARYLAEHRGRELRGEPSRPVGELLREVARAVSGAVAAHAEVDG
ncbi:bifunctional DNA primase/polymerase [Gordonia terrae]|uniref:bifunctional DNA primase/polymerase n=1 Tax=Gordonia hongkongensis TaxID=1701090 RepID=UPI0022B59EAC|nr:bifunctional DNA primase/polymerase [Gordonia terrae]